MNKNIEVIHLSRECITCRNDRGQKLGEINYAIYDKYSIAEKVQLVGCTKCGSVFYNTSSNKEDFLNYYKNHYYYNTSNVQGSGGLTESDSVRFAETISIVKKFNVPYDSHIIDIGCAKGGLLLKLKEEGFINLIGIDPLSANVDLVKSLVGAAVEGHASDIPLENESCSLIILTHILEHVYDMAEAFEELNRVIKSDGLIYIEVPNLSGYPAYDRAPLWDFLYEHINHFDSEMLKHMMLRYGYITLDIGNKQLESGCGGDTCIYGVFKKSNDLYGSLCRRSALTDSLPNLFEIPEHIAHFIENNSGIASCIHVWGLSSYMLHLLKTYLIPNFDVIKLYDADPYKQSLTIDGTKIESPDRLAELMDDDILLISSGPHQIKMCEYFASHGFKAKFIVL